MIYIVIFVYETAAAVKWYHYIIIGKLYYIKFCHLLDVVMLIGKLPYIPSLSFACSYIIIKKVNNDCQRRQLTDTSPALNFCYFSVLNHNIVGEDCTTLN